MATSTCVYRPKYRLKYQSIVHNLISILNPSFQRHSRSVSDYIDTHTTTNIVCLLLCVEMMQRETLIGGAVKSAFGSVKSMSA